MSNLRDQLAEQREVQAWTRRVRPIIASRRPYAKKVEALVAAGCSETNAAYLARLPASQFDIGNNSAWRDQAVTLFEARVQGAAPKTITVTKIAGNEWSAQAGALTKRGGNPRAAVINLVEAHSEVAE